MCIRSSILLTCTGVSLNFWENDNFQSVMIIIIMAQNFNDNPMSVNCGSSWMIIILCMQLVLLKHLYYTYIAHWKVFVL